MVETAPAIGEDIQQFSKTAIEKKLTDTGTKIALVTERVTLHFIAEGVEKGVVFLVILY